MKRPISIVDAFTDEAFRGNPAAVCLLDSEMPDSWLQSVAMEMNLAETAFLLPEGDAYRLRWFTPTVEVVLCGHATLASAHVLWETGKLGVDSPAKFQTLSGLLTCTQAAGKISMDFPARPCVETIPPPGLEVALGVAPTWMGSNGMDLIAVYEREEEVRQLEPDLAALAKLEARGMMVTAPSTGSQDFVSRFFAPGAGIPEDPVTGSAHCALGPYWAAKLGKNCLIGYQASSRGGFVEVEVRDDRCHLRGKAVTTLEGFLTC